MKYLNRANKTANNVHLEISFHKILPLSCNINNLVNTNIFSTLNVFFL